MLSSYDRRQFNQIVAGLLAEDPEFAMRQPAPARQLPPRPLVAMLLWLSMPFMVTVGGWTGLLIACVAAGYGVHLWSRGQGGQAPPGVATTRD